MTAAPAHLAHNGEVVIDVHGLTKTFDGRAVVRDLSMQVKRGTMFSKFYVVQVEHEFVPFTGFFTTLSVERGTGFAERAKWGGGMASPYYSELSNV